MTEGNGANKSIQLTTNQKLEYETCTALVKHYETLRMGLMQFFAVFNGASLAFFMWLVDAGSGISLGNFGVLVYSLFASIICFLVLNGEIREMSYWTTFIMRARRIEERINSRNKYTDLNEEPGPGFMDTYRGNYREVVQTREFLQGEPEEGYAKPKYADIIWGRSLFRVFGGSRRDAMPVFYLIPAIFWLGFHAYSVYRFVTHQGVVAWSVRLAIIPISITVLFWFIKGCYSGIRKRDLV